jgi:hypothetical protein
MRSTMKNAIPKFGIQGLVGYSLTFLRMQKAKYNDGSVVLTCKLHSPTNPDGLLVNSLWTPDKIQIDSMTSMWTPSGVYKEFTRSPSGVFKDFVETIYIFS